MAEDLMALVLVRCILVPCIPRGWSVKQKVYIVNVLDYSLIPVAIKKVVV